MVNRCRVVLHRAVRAEGESRHGLGCERRSWLKGTWPVRNSEGLHGAEVYLSVAAEVFLVLHEAVALVHQEWVCRLRPEEGIGFQVLDLRPLVSSDAMLESGLRLV